MIFETQKTIILWRSVFARITSFKGEDLYDESRGEKTPMLSIGRYI